MFGQGFPGSSDGKESACNAGNLCSIPGLGKIPWRKAWQPTPVFLPGESHGQRRLVGYSPFGCKESDMTEQLTHTHTKKKVWSHCISKTIGLYSGEIHITLFKPSIHSFL